MRLENSRELPLARKQCQLAYPVTYGIDGTG